MNGIVWCNWPRVILVTLFLVVWSLGGKGPLKKSLRPLAMGNAFVAVVDDKDALHYNPAGLNLIGRLGNQSKHPQMSHYRSNSFDLRVELGAGGNPRYFRNFGSTLQSYGSSSVGSLDSLKNDTTIVKKLATLDRKGIPLSILGGADFAVHNFGVGVWSQLDAEPFWDAGIILPQGGLHTLTLDMASEVGFAYSFLEHDRLAIGATYRVAWRRRAKLFQFSVSDIWAFYSASGEPQYLRDSLGVDLGTLQLGHGLDVGVLWQQDSEWRFGTVVQNMFMSFKGEVITPELTVGAVYSPVALQNNYLFKRKVNFALDYEDALNDDKGYKALSKINMGAEWEQVLIPYLFESRLATGFKGGYWTGGMGVNVFAVLHFHLVTWAEEEGYYTGHDPQRYYVFQFEVGI